MFAAVAGLCVFTENINIGGINGHSNKKQSDDTKIEDEHGYEQRIS